VGQSGRLRKQSAVNQGRDEIAYRFSLHQHLVVNQVVTGVQVDHPNIERAAPTCRFKQRRVSFGMIDGESMGLSRHNPDARWRPAAPIVRRGRRRCHRLTHLIKATFLANLGWPPDDDRIWSCHARRSACGV